MSGKIYLIQDDDTLLEMNEKPYSNEDILQTLLEKYPDLLAGEQMNREAPRRWLLISREVGVPGELDGPNRWSLDHLFLDQDGIPTLIEVKRSSDHRIRREVVGQLLDYAANAVVYWPIEKIRADFEVACSIRGDQADMLVQELVDPAGDGEADVESFWQLVKTNLQAGKVRLVFVADVIPAELRRIIEFLNEQMNPAEVLGVEIRQYAGQQLRTLVPQVVGQTAEAQQIKSSASRTKRKWDEPTFFAEFVRQNGDLQTAVSRQLLNWANSAVSYIRWGEGFSNGSFMPILVHNEVHHRLFAIYTSSGTIEINFQQYVTYKQFELLEKRKQLQQKLNNIPKVMIHDDSLSKRPSIPVEILTEGDNLQRFIEVLDWFVDEIKKSDVTNSN